MESTCARRAHLAVTKAEYTKIKGKEGRIDPSVFSFSPQKTYFKLFFSGNAALRQAFKSRTIESAQVAREDTTFCFLTLYFTDEQWLHLFFAALITMGPQRKAYRLYGTFKIGAVKQDWHRMKLCMIGIDGWADYALEKCIWCPKGLCAECEVNDIKVYKQNRKCKKEYCSQCWYTYVRNMWENEGQQNSQREED